LSSFLFSLPAREVHFLAWPRKSTQKEGHPEPCPAGSLALPVFCARAKLAALRQLLACFAKYRQYSAAAKGFNLFDWREEKLTIGVSGSGESKVF